MTLFGDQHPLSDWLQKLQDLRMVDDVTAAKLEATEAPERREPGRVADRYEVEQLIGRGGRSL